jgi:hypothetical protein
MEIRVHTPHVETDGQDLEGLVDRALERYAERLTRVEVFLRDENAGKGGLDKHCTLEARPRGLDPLVAGHQAATAAEAVAGAAGKLERLLERRLGKLGEPR